MARTPEYNLNEVVENAMNVFWQKGFEATSMADIYSATGLKPASVYTAFKSKDEFFRVIFQKYTEHFRRSFPEGLDGFEAIESWISNQAKLSSEDTQRKGCLLINTILERGVHTETTRAMAQSRLEEIRRFFLKQLLIAKERKEIDRKVDVEIAADSLLGVTMSIMTLGRAGADKSTIFNVATSALNSLRH